MSVPRTLLRFFSKEEYAQSFIAGKVRFGLLNFYKTVEDSRRDKTEGTAIWNWKNLPNPIYGESSSITTRYILCSSHPKAERSVLAKRFGPYIVQINEPMTLKERINFEWRSHPWASSPLAPSPCIIKQVVYNKGESLEATEGLIPPWDYSYCQKPRKIFEVEMEFRYVLACSGDPKRVLENCLWLTLPDCSDICVRL